MSTLSRLFGRPVPSPRPASTGQATASRQTIEVVHAGVTHRVAVKRVATARRFTLRVRAANPEAVLTMPPRASLKTALAFAERHAAWIATRLGALPGRIPLSPDAVVPLRGIDHRIVLDRSVLRRVEPGMAADGTPLLRVSSRAAEPAVAVHAFLMAEARRDLAAAARRHAAAVGKPIARITVRDTRSRWGSCSSRGTLNFSWRLILAPPFVLDYLAAHEVAHLVHLDHSEAFWRVTRGLAPETDAAETWLKRHGPGLHRYEAPATVA